MWLKAPNAQFVRQKIAWAIRSDHSRERTHFDIMPHVWLRDSQGYM